MTDVNIPGVGMVHFPDDMPPDQVAAHAKRLHDEAQGPSLMASHDPAATGPSASGEPTHPHARVGRFVTENLPAIAAAGSGLLTGGMSLLPAAGIAALAGGAGAAARHGIRRVEGRAEPKTASELGLDIAKEGAWEGGTQLAGGALIKGAGMAGRGLYRTALSAPKALRMEYPDLVETGIREGINVTEKGAEQAAARKMASASAARGMVASANSTAAPIAAREVMPAFAPAHQAMRAARSIGKDTTTDMASVGARAKGVARSFGGAPGAPGAIDVVTAQARKEAAQDAAEAAYGKGLRGQPVNDLEMLTDKHLASRYQQAIEQRVPGVGAQNANTQSLMGLERAIEDANLRPRRLSNLLALPTAGTSLVLNSPRVLGRAGIVLGRTGQATPQIPANLLRAALMAQMDDAQEP